MKVKMMIVAFAIAFAMATQVSAQCGPCDAVHPCNACNTCCTKPCDLFSGLKNLLQCRPSVIACAPCEPIVACGPSFCDPGARGACDPCNVNACDPCNVDACGPCGNGFKFGGFGLFNRCNPCGPGACDAGCGPGACDAGCGPGCDTGCGPGACDAGCGPFAGCDPCGPSACGGCGFGDCGCPGPVASFLIKSRVGAKKLFKNLLGSLDCGYDCGACGPVACGPCGDFGGLCGNGCGPQACEVAAPSACGCCR